MDTGTTNSNQDDDFIFCCQYTWQEGQAHNSLLEAK